MLGSEFKDFIWRRDGRRRSGEWGLGPGRDGRRTETVVGTEERKKESGEFLQSVSSRAESANRIQFPPPSFSCFLFFSLSLSLPEHELLPLRRRRRRAVADENMPFSLAQKEKPLAPHTEANERRVTKTMERWREFIFRILLPFSALWFGTLAVLTR